MDTILVGISQDDLTSHESFMEKYDLNATLLSDTDGSVCDAYGVCTDGKGFRRSTFVINADGNLAAVLRDVDPVEHIPEVELFIRENLH